MSVGEDILVAREAALDPEDFIDVLKRSTLAGRRPVDDAERIAGMVANADLIVTARDPDGLLVGVSRCVTDFVYCCYCADLAVDAAFQGRGIGRRLIAESRAHLHPDARFDLIAAPKAVTYYEHIGMERVPHCFRLRG